MNLHAATLDVLPTGIAYMRTTGRFLHVNTHLCGLLGYDSDALVRRTLQDVTLDADRPVITALTRQIVDGAASPQSCDVHLVRKDDAPIWVQARLAAIRDTGGAIQFLVATVEDVTGKKESDRTLRESEERLRALVAASPLGIDIMDLDGCPIFYNPRCEELHGIDIGAAGTDGWTTAVHPEDRPRVTSTWYEAARAGRPWQDIYRFLHADGTVVWVSGRAGPMHVHGKLIGFVGTLEDITALKQAEHAVRESEAKLSALAEERARLLEHEQLARSQAEGATHVREATMAVLAHDLRDPINAIALSAASLRNAKLPDDQRLRRLETIERSVAMTERLIRDLLDVSRMEAGVFRVRRDVVAVAELVEEVHHLFALQAEARNIAFTCEVGPGAATVTGDRERLLQALSNLAGNALKFTSPHGRVHLRAERRRAHVEMAVEDTGPGIPDKDVPHIFDRFWQSTASRSASAGLGLAVAKGIVEAHGGSISVASEVGRGTTFHVVLPATE